MSTIAPTVGRKVWVWEGENLNLSVLDPNQPFDATVLFVASDGSVNLSVTDHEGNDAVMFGVKLRDPKEGDKHDVEAISIATWMPYQVGQARQADANQTSVPTPTLAPAVGRPPSPFKQT